MKSSLAQTLALGTAALFLSACHHEKKATAAPGDADHSGAASEASGGEASVDTGAKIKCFGANECTAQGACDVPDGRVAPGSKGHDCAGQNSCRGKGWVLATKTECNLKGGQPL